MYGQLIVALWLQYMPQLSYRRSQGVQVLLWSGGLWEGLNLRGQKEAVCISFIP